MFARETDICRPRSKTFPRAGIASARADVSSATITFGLDLF
jgi:hypothetical protein